MPKDLEAPLVKGEHKGAWTRVELDHAHATFGTRGLVRVRGTLDDVPFEGALMAQGDGTHRLPVRAALGKQASAVVRVRLDRR